MNVKVGIDAIEFYTPNYYLDLAVLAEKRNVDVNKFNVGLGQFKMAMPAPSEDIVTMAANAASKVLKHIDNPDEIGAILIGTESSFDLSKSIGTYLHRLLKLNSACRIVELKQACYAGTAGLQLGSALALQNPSKKVLVIATDIARYSMNSAAESSQGSAAVAMIVSTNPRIIALEPSYGVHTEDVMDFFRPKYTEAAIVEGRYSSLLYLKILETAWKRYQEASGLQYQDIDFTCYHSPVPRLVEKAQRLLARVNGQDIPENIAKTLVADSLMYSRLIGNSYTAALYVNVISLLENHQNDLAGKRLGFYSYGSGCVAEYFAGIVQPGYKQVLNAQAHQKMLDDREALTYEAYDSFYHAKLPEDGSEYLVPGNYHTGRFKLTGIENHKRTYISL